MNKITYLSFFSMLVALFIYLFYRTEATVINTLFIQLFSDESYSYFKRSIGEIIHLPQLVIFSLPEGLWVFSTTLLSSYHSIQYKSFTFRLIYLPLFIAIVLEFLQLIHMSNGHFDIFDVLVSMIFWCLGYFIVYRASTYQTYKKKNSVQFKICCLTYLSIYLAHVWT